MLKGVDRILVGASGGVDSAVLTHQLCALRDKGGPKISVVHIHHGVRGEEGDHDMRLAEELARSHDCDFHVEHLQFSKKRKPSEQEMREKRLAALEKLARQLEITRIALAHHRDDQAETVVMRFLGGADIRGLAGIPYYRAPFWVHPLLGVSREEILREANGCHLPFGEDSTNRSLGPVRNRLRHVVLPLLAKEFNPSLSEHLSGLSESLWNLRDFLDQTAEEVLKRAFRDRGVYGVEELRKASEAVRTTALQMAYRQLSGPSGALNRSQVRILNRLVMTDGDSRMVRLPRRVVVVREEDLLHFGQID